MVVGFSSLRSAVLAMDFVRLASINSRAFSAVLLCNSVFGLSDCFRRPTLLLPRSGALAGAVAAFSTAGFELVGAAGGTLLGFPGGAGGPLGARFAGRRFCLGEREFGEDVDFLGFLLNGFDGSSFDPKSSCLRPDLKPTCHKGWLPQFGSVP